MSGAHQWETHIDQALRPLGENLADEIKPMVWTLFEIIYPDLLGAVEGNPLEHHPIVLGHMMEIFKEDLFPYASVEAAAALALLHDISPVEKITTQMVAAARKEDTARGDALELRRRQNRVLHMREGSSMAHRRLLEMNQRWGGIAFDGETIDVVCEAIRIHDNPSLNIPIPRANWLSVAFREADRLWMITHEGICADLARKKRDISDPDAYRRQLDANIDRFREERSLYRPLEPTEGPFCDDQTFFRTRTGCTICNRLSGEGKKRVAQMTG